MRYLTLVICVCVLSACGQKGSLYLPAKKTPTAPSSTSSQP